MGTKGENTAQNLGSSRPHLIHKPQQLIRIKSKLRLKELSSSIDLGFKFGKKLLFLPGRNFERFPKNLVRDDYFWDDEFFGLVFDE